MFEIGRPPVRPHPLGVSKDASLKQRQNPFEIRIVRIEFRI